MTNEPMGTRWDERSPFATIPSHLLAPELLADGPVRYLLVAGELDDGSWGSVGAFWRTLDRERGGFLVAPRAIWHGSEMVRSFEGARERGWSVERIFEYWEGLVGHSGKYMVDPIQHAETLFQVARDLEMI